MIPTTIVDFYFRDRANADTTDEKRRVWRTYARAVIEEFQRPERRAHTIGAPVIIWRRAANDDTLPIRCPPYWASVPLPDLQALWLALERARAPATPS